MSGHVYVLDEHSRLLPMESQPYDSEALLQELLARHPDLLAGEQIGSNEPRRWLLVTREMPVPCAERGSGRWSVDHLFLDQDGIPTLVEVKRSSNTQIRREIAGQMLDYAANAVAYWPVEDIRARFEAQCEANGADPEQELGNLLREEDDTADFWQRVKTNLQAGRIRMVFVADEIPPELRRIVEFLNGQMDPAEVVAIEIKQFAGHGMKTLVPRVVGQTEIARQKKSSGGARRAPISEEEFFAEFDAERTAQEQRAARRLIAWARENGLQDDFKRGVRGSAFIPVFEHEGHRFRPLVVHQRGVIRIPMRRMRDRPPFHDETKRQQLHEQIKEIPGLSVTDAGMEGFPTFPLKSLADETVLENFIQTLDWMISQIRSS